MMRTYSRKKQAHHLIEDVDQLCRLCLEKAEEKVPIFTEGAQNIAALALRIMICVGIEVTDMKCLPNSICLKCQDDLENYYRFRKKCEASYQRIKSHIIAVKERETIRKKRDIEIILKDSQAESEMIVPALQLVDEEIARYEMERGEKEEQMEEIQVIEQSPEASTSLQTFLTSILTELSILVNTEQGLVVQDQGVSSFQVETGDDDVISFQLVEEDEEEPNNADQHGIPEEVISIVNNVDIENFTDNAEAENIDNEFNLFVDNPVNNKTKANQRGPWCGICGKAFCSSSVWKRHMRVHSGVRPYACDACPRTFGQKAVRDRHRLVHQEKRPFPCASCDKSFTQRAALAAHARRHDRAPAPAARQPAASAPALSAPAQMQLHACPHCDKVFLYPSGLSRHMFVHSGRTYSCTLCGRRFTDRSSVARHLRNKHAQHQPG